MTWRTTPRHRRNVATCALVVAALVIGGPATALADDAPAEPAGEQESALPVDRPPAEDAPADAVETGEVDGATVAVGAPPVPPSADEPVVAVGAPPVPPSAQEAEQPEQVEVAVGLPPVPPSAPSQPAPSSQPASASLPTEPKVWETLDGAADAADAVSALIDDCL